MTADDAAARFSNRVADYVRARPSYPPAAIDFVLANVLAEADSTQADGAKSLTIADVGAGTGISAALFLARGATVVAIEPNAAMRGAAEKLLGGNPRFRSVDGTAETTTLPDRSVDLVVAAQAFHWFDVPRARWEFARITRAPSRCALLWNTRRPSGSPFLAAYESLLAEFGLDYAQVRHENIEAAALEQFFVPGTYRSRKFENVQRLDLDGLIARLASSSYLPSVEHPRYAAMLDAARKMFAEQQRDGGGELVYDAEVHFGCVSA